MSVVSQLSQATVAAMKSRDAKRLEPLRYLKAQVQNAQIDKPNHAELTDAEVQQIIRRLVKQTEEAITDFKRGGRDDLATAEEEKVAVWREFLPQGLTAEELRALVGEIIAANPGLGVGPLTGKVLQAAAGRADGAQVNAVIRELLPA